MISLILSAMLSQVSLPPTSVVPLCKSFSHSYATAMTEDTSPSGHHVYSEFETVDCGSISAIDAWVVVVAIDYPIFNAVDCARVAPRVEAFDGNGNPRAPVPLRTTWEGGTCRTTGYVFSLFGPVRLFVRSDVPQSRLLLGAYDR